MDLVALAGLVSGAATAIGGVAGASRVVAENERGIILRFGKAVRHKKGPLTGQVRIIEPGFRLIYPKVDNLRKVHMRATTINLDSQEIMLKDRTVFDVGAMVIVRVKDTPDDIYAALFETDDLYGSVADYCAAELRDLMSGMTWPQMSDAAGLEAQATARVTERLDAWGLKIEDFKLTDCSPNAATARLLLTATDTEFRASALLSAARQLGTDAASINPQLAAALIGTPIGVTIGSVASGSRIPAARTSQLGDDEEDGDDPALSITARI